MVERRLLRRTGQWIEAEDAPATGKATGERGSHQASAAAMDLQDGALQMHYLNSYIRIPNPSIGSVNPFPLDSIGCLDPAASME